MKKKFLFVLLLVITTLKVYSAPVDSRNGYKDLLWGSSLTNVKMAGYQLELMSQDVIDSEQKLYKQNLKIYEVHNVSDKAISQLFFYFVDDKLIRVREKLNKSEIRENKLVARYGKFSNDGLHKFADNIYADTVYDDEGYVQRQTIYILVSNEYAMTDLYDWDSFSKVSRKALIASGKANISDELFELALDLLRNTSKTKRISVAFIALTSDQKNSFVENYVTDALTQAVFETNGVKIIERKNLEKILNEQKFQSSGLVDDSSAKDIGKIAGVDYVCYGDMKDIGNEITVNARLVDVESGEVISISRTTVEKDKYLKDYVKQQAEVIKQNKIMEQKKQEEKLRKIESSDWKVTKVRNDFDEKTIFTIKCMNPDGTYLLFGYEKSDKSIKSRVRCSVPWGMFNGQIKDFDFKGDSGEITKINQKAVNSFDWDIKNGVNYEKKSDSYERVYKVDVTSSKLLFEMFCNNNIVYVRDNKTVRPFATEGFLDVLAANGITVDEIQKAFANESF